MESENKNFNEEKITIKESMSKTKGLKAHAIVITVLSCLVLCLTVALAYTLLSYDRGNSEEVSNIHSSEAVESFEEIETESTVTNTNESNNIIEEALVPEDYIYFSNWGIKIKKPENIKHVAYECGTWGEDNCRILLSNNNELHLEYGEETVGYDVALIFSRGNIGSFSKNPSDGIAKPTLVATIDGKEYGLMIVGADLDLMDNLAKEYYYNTENYSAI